MNKRLKKVLGKPQLLLAHVMMVPGVSTLFSDELYLKLLYYLYTGHRLDLEHPQSFNEKLNWEKLYYRHPLMPKLVDKYDAKAYVAEKIGSEHVVPNYGVWNTPEEVDFDSLPEQFVLKCTHNSGTGMYICRDKRKMDVDKVKEGLRRGLKERFYMKAREWAYKDAHPRIIADKFLDDHSGAEIQDYKFLCFNGKPKYVYQSVKGKFVYENWYDMDFQPVNINNSFPRRLPEFEKPKGFEKMKELAAKLSAGFPHVRIDFFDVEGHVYFAEFAFYNWAGIMPFEDYEMDLELGKHFILPEKIS